MKFMTVRGLGGRPGQGWNQLAHECDLVLISNGKPVAILSAVSEDNPEESFSAVRRASAVAAVEKVQSHSIETGTDKLSLEDITTEVKAVRTAKRKCGLLSIPMRLSLGSFLLSAHKEKLS
ncbi:type II toxin-antitoxin system Phd/YefM family antitoxin [Nitrospira sp. MA-1]|nr:type II toxin-antitoxin system Phd/YefM family antitoxin [Nitrospira sp. MA-1]